MGATLTEQRRVGDDALRGVNPFSAGRRWGNPLDGTGGRRWKKIRKREKRGKNK